MHRIERVLRLQVGEQLILFNRERHAAARISSLDRKRVVLEILSVAENKRYMPSIMFLLPLLKKDALAQAVYFLVEAGVNAIQLIQPDNAHRKWGGQKELERLERIVIASAEQSKHFAFPEIKEPISLSDVVSELPTNSWRFYGDPVGSSIKTIMNDAAPDAIVLTCGPEADFSLEEKEKLRAVSFQPLRLTPTILRAETAAFCISSLFRSVFS